MKLKTRKAAAKRFKVTSTGKIFANRSGKRHLLGHKSSKSKRNKGPHFEVAASDLNRVEQMLRAIL